ncbi:MAG: cobalt-precorrin 5A hydrolase [Faecousia sp.]
MKAALFAFSHQGCETARRVMQCLPPDTVQAYTVERLGEPDFQTIPPSPDFYGRMFRESDAMVFVGSCGIAVRKIAPYVRDKQTDPAVVVLDELGTFVIPILSGHIGGANDLARDLAGKLGATPVVTTATDIHHKFSVDAWAARNGCAISDMKAAKCVSAAILEEAVPLCSEFPIVTGLPNGVIPGKKGKVGICISVHREEPFERTLRLIPKVLHLGIGCRKGISADAVREAVEGVFNRYGLDFRAVKCAASIDLKAQEPGLLEFSRERNLPVSFYSAQELQSVPGEFTPSEFVRSVTGVDNVCERAALMGGSRLIVKKTAGNGVTVAVAAEDWEVHFWGN